MTVCLAMVTALLAPAATAEPGTALDAQLDAAIAAENHSAG